MLLAAAAAAPRICKAETVAAAVVDLVVIVVGSSPLDVLAQVTISGISRLCTVGRVSSSFGSVRR